MSDEDLVRAFLAKSAPTKVAEGVAYGVDKEADKAKRLVERERRAAERREQEIEYEAERYMEDVREAYHVGGRSAALDAMNTPRRWRY